MEHTRKPLISLLLPTRKRVHLVRRLLKSLEDTVSTLDNVEVILYVDEDDTESQAISHPSIRLKRIVGTPGTTMGTIFNESFGHAEGRYIMLLNDDMVFRTRNWDLRVISAFEGFKDDIGFVYGNDLDQGKAVPTFPILSRRVCEIMGEVCPPEYRNLHIESHLIDIFKELERLGYKRIVYLDDVIFEHLHHVVGKAEMDETYRGKKDPLMDERLFVSLSERRKAIAKTLALYIEGKYRLEEKEFEFSTVLFVFDHKAKGLGRTLNRLFELYDAGYTDVVVVKKKGVTHVITGGRNIKVVDAESEGEFLQKGIASAGHRLVVLLSPGVIPGESIYQRSKELFKDGNAGLVGFRIINERTGGVHHAGVCFFRDQDGLWATHIYRGIPGGEPVVARPRTLQAVGGGCVVVDRTLVEGLHIQGVSPELYELAISATVKRKKGKIVYLPDVTLYRVDDSIYGDCETLLTASPQLKGLCEGLMEEDLEAVLKQDGYELKRLNGVYSVLGHAPSTD